MKAIIMDAFGGPEVLKYQDCPDPVPSKGQALVKLEAIGVNFTDVYSRTGVYPLHLPATIGVEGAGVVVSLGEGVTEVKEGDLVAYADTKAMGAYAEQSIVPTDRLVKMPAGTNAQLGATAMLQGMTAHYLCHSTYPLKENDMALVHAGAGGVGLLLIQMCKRLGAHVFATVSTDEKSDLAKAAGADQTIIYTREDFEEEIMKATNGQGVQVVYDSVGKDTFDKSLNCLARLGYLVLYGNSSGVVPPIAPTILANKSRFLTRPGLGDHTATRGELLDRAGDVLAWVQSGDLSLRIGGTFSLSDAAQAHRALESRKTTGKLLLIP